MNDDAILEQAALWHAGQESDAMDWSGFEAWLGADPRHRAAFDAIALLDADVDRHRETLRRLLAADGATLPAVERRSQRKAWVGGGAAVAAAAVLAVVAYRAPSPQTPAAATYLAAAEPRDLRVGDARITLAPRSRITHPDGDPTRLALSGRAVFAVRHDPARTVVVRAEGYDIRDVGTRFEVVAGAGLVRVRVAEGEVAIVPASGGASIRVPAGSAATGFADGRIVTAKASPSPPRETRQSPLVYDAMPLGLVVADIARETGRPLVADPGVAARPFSGVLAVGDAETTVRTLATLAGLEVRRQGDTIHLGNRVSR